MPWRQWFQENFDKLLLAALWIGALSYVDHMLHSSLDAANVGWGREIASGLMGALLGLITGARLSRGNGQATANTLVVTPPAQPPIT